MDRRSWASRHRCSVRGTGARRAHDGTDCGVGCAKQTCGRQSGGGNIARRVPGSETRGECGSFTVGQPGGPPFGEPG
jgi:hypothetical protein